MRWILLLVFGLIHLKFSVSFANQRRRWLRQQQQHHRRHVASFLQTTKEVCSDDNGASVVVQLSKRKNLSWEESYELLCEYRKEHGNCNVPQLQKPLGTFVNRQRVEYARFKDPSSNKTTAMTFERKEMLDDIGFVWDIVEHTWNLRYAELCEFRKENGHSVVPRSHGPLGAWVEKQRIEYKKYKTLDESDFAANSAENLRTTLTKERVQKLDDVDFVYDVREKQFEENIGALRIFYKEHKHIDPRLMDGKLASWVRKMKQQYLKHLNNQDISPINATNPSKTMSKSRIDALENAGFTPSMFNEPQEPIVTHRFSWNERYHELIEFEKIHGHCVVPKNYGSLGSWVRAQRHLMNRDGPMAQDRIELLNKLGFVWDVHQWQWNQSYHELLDWKAVNNNTNVPVSQGALGLWVSNQRSHYHKYRQGKPSHMTQSRAEQLRSIGFEFYPGKKRLASVDEKWYLSFVELKRYHDANGTCNLKQNENPTLYAWCQHQKACYRKKMQGKHSPLKKSRQEALQSIGFFDGIK